MPATTPESCTLTHPDRHASPRDIPQNPHLPAAAPRAFEIAAEIVEREEPATGPDQRFQVDVERQLALWNGSHPGPLAEGAADREFPAGIVRVAQCLDHADG